MKRQARVNNVLDGLSFDPTIGVAHGDVKAERDVGVCGQALLIGRKVELLYARRRR
jgi:hypothetical protein